MANERYCGCACAHADIFAPTHARSMFIVGQNCRSNIILALFLRSEIGAVLRPGDDLESNVDKLLKESIGLIEMDVDVDA